MKGVYSGDVSHYHKMGLAAGIVKSKTFPKRFVFVGRYNQVKGLEDLISAFDSAKNELKDWEFWFTGAGDLDSLISNKTGMRNLGFIQPKDMEPILKETSIFVLPSRYEPWGLALHEFAAAGFPVIVSNEVGAKEAFLVEGENGFSFPASDVMALKKVLIKMAMLSSSQWLEMGKKSTMLALKNTPKDWCEKFLSAKI